MSEKDESQKAQQAESTEAAAAPEGQTPPAGQPPQAQPPASPPPPPPQSAPPPQAPPAAPQAPDEPPPPPPPPIKKESVFPDNEKPLGLLAHLLYLACCAGPVVNLILWQVWKNPDSGKSSELVFQLKQAFFYQLVFVVIGLGLWIIQLIVNFIGIPFLGILLSVLSLLVMIAGLVLAIIAGIKVFQGEPFEYPVLGAKLRESNI